MDIRIELLKKFYFGKTPNDTDVQLRSPIDVFTLIEIIKEIEREYWFRNYRAEEPDWHFEEDAE